MSVTNKIEINWTVRPMKHDDIEDSLRLWSQVNLFEAPHSVRVFFNVDPDGFYVAELKDTGEIIGTIAATSNRPDTAFMGYYAVNPEYQGNGIGLQLWKKVVNRCPNMGLYAIPKMVPKYKYSGFIIEDNFSMTIHEGTPNITGLKDIGKLDGCSLEVINSETNDDILKALFDFDADVQGYPRMDLLRHQWTDKNAPLSLAVIKCLGDKNLKVLGFGSIAADNLMCGLIHLVYAESSDIFEVIIRNLISLHSPKSDQIIRAFVPSSNKEAYDILTEAGMTRNLVCPRLFTKFLPSGKVDKIFCLHSPCFCIF